MLARNTARALDVDESWCVRVRDVGKDAALRDAEPFWPRLAEIRQTGSAPPEKASKPEAPVLVGVRPIPGKHPNDPHSGLEAAVGMACKFWAEALSSHVEGPAFRESSSDNPLDPGLDPPDSHPAGDPESRLLRLRVVRTHEVSPTSVPGVSLPGRIATRTPLLGLACAKHARVRRKARGGESGVEGASSPDGWSLEGPGPGSSTLWAIVAVSSKRARTSWARGATRRSCPRGGASPDRFFHAFLAKWRVGSIRSTTRPLAKILRAIEVAPHLTVLSSPPSTRKARLFPAGPAEVTPPASEPHEMAPGHLKPPTSPTETPPSPLEPSEGEAGGPL